MIANLTSDDVGPVATGVWNSFGNWQKKYISSSTNIMLVEFRSDDQLDILEKDFVSGFSVSLHYSPMLNKDCETGLDQTMKIIHSPKYPQLYETNISCKWLITVPYGLHLRLKFLEFDVRFYSKKWFLFY